MNKLFIICLVTLLSACTTNIALIDRNDGSIDGVGTLNRSLTSDDVISVRLEGRITQANGNSVTALPTLARTPGK